MANQRPDQLTALTASGASSSDLFVIYDVSASTLKKMTPSEIATLVAADIPSDALTASQVSDVVPSRAAVAYAMWQLVAVREFPGVDPFTVDWEADLTHDWGSGLTAAWMYAIQWPSFNLEIHDGVVDSDSGIALVVTKDGPILIGTQDTTLLYGGSGIPAFTFEAGDPSNDRYDVFYVTVDPSDSSWSWGIWRGTPSVGKDATEAAFYAQAGDYDAVVKLALVPNAAASWDDCTMEYLREDGESAFRKVAHVVMNHGDFSSEFQPVDKMFWCAGQTAIHNSSWQHGEDTNDYILDVYVDDVDHANDTIAMFGADGVTPSDIPTVDFSSETTAVGQVCTMLAKLGLIIDANA